MTSLLSSTPIGVAIARRLVRVASCYAILGGTVSLAGWVIDWPRLSDWDNNGIFIQPNAAVAAVFAGCALWLLQVERRRASFAAAAAVFAIGVATLAEHLLSMNLGLDRWLLFGRAWGGTGTLSPGRMGPPASFCWTIVGLALLLISSGRRHRRIATLLGALSIFVATLSLTGYLLGAELLYSLPWLTVVAFQTATLILASGLGILFAVPEVQPARGFLSASAGGVVIRRLFPWVVSVPLLVALLVKWGVDHQWYDLNMGLALLVLAVTTGSGVAVWWGSAAVDRYERKLAAAAAATHSAIAGLNTQLTTSVRELEAVFRAAPAGIAVSRDRECADVRVNDAFAVIMGTDADYNPSLTGPNAGRLPFVVLDEAGQPVPAEALPLQTAARTGEAVLDRTLRLRRADGRIVTIRGSAVPVRDASESIGGAISVFLDVSAERAAAEERELLLTSAESLRVEAEAANRAKDQFLAVLSHELRSPLNAMLGWVHILKRTAADDVNVSKAVNTLERNIRAQTQIINDLLDISRIASGKFELDRLHLELEPIVLEAVESLRPMAVGKGLELVLELGDAPVQVNADSARLRQIVTNVVHNAIKFTPDGGRVVVAVAADQRIVRIDVTDTGLGISSELLPKVFDRFVQDSSSTTRQHGGLGLGLAIVKQLTHLHGGTVEASSEGPGRGTRITISLPRLASHEVSPARPLAPASGRTLEMLDILVVEDNDDSREAMGLALAHTGATVRLAESVAAAIACYEVRPPDILISDIGMPGADGYSLIRAIRDREEGSGRRTLAIAMTGFASRLDHETALRAGFDEHIGKPVEFEALLERLTVLRASQH